VDDDALPRGIGRPATDALHEAGYSRLSELAGVPARELLALHGVGSKAVRVLQAALESRGSSLG
jgi:hypothetical protein